MMQTRKRKLLSKRSLSSTMKVRSSRGEKKTVAQKSLTGKKPRDAKEILIGSEKVTVLFAVNNGYAPYLGVALASLVKHAGRHEYELIVLYHDLSERNREVLSIIIEKFKGKSTGQFRLRFVEMPLKEIDYDFAPGYKPLSIETWFRLLAPSLFPEYDKILWLDADIMVRDDVAKLYATDVGDNWIGACRWDYGIIGTLEREKRRKSAELRNYFTKVLGIKNPRNDYVNAGVLLLNLKDMRENNVQEKLLQAAHNHSMYFHDQCVINMVCHKHICYLDSVWNGLAGFNMDSLPKKYREKALHDKQTRKIIHWAGLYKPWREPWCKAAVEWWDIARLTPYYEEIIYTNIYAILDEKMNRESSELENKLIELEKALTELGKGLT